MASRVLRKNRENYSYLKDPHLFYHLESPIKIQQLLESGLYQLDGNRIVQIETLDSLQLSPFTLEKVPTEIRDRHSQRVRDSGKQSRIEENASKSVKIEKPGAPNVSPYQINISMVRIPKKKGLEVRGLKEFQKKIL